MKKYLIKIGFFIIAIFLWLLILYSKSIWNFIDKLANNDKGLLVTIYNEITFFFRYSDTWNIIFIILIICFSFLSWMIIEIVLSKFISKFNFLKNIKNKSINRIIYHSTFKYISFKILSITILFFTLWLITNVTIIIYANYKITSSIDNLEKNDVLLLGTSKYLSDGKNINLYYKYRIEAIKKLHQNDKINHIIISGDRKKNTNYNEPKDMQNDLIKAGINKNMISLDFAGYRTLDSILRLASLFKSEKVIIVSQKFHIERAIFQSFFYRIDATGFKADGTMTTSMFIRELFAKPKVILDLFFFNMQPKAEKAYTRSSFSVSSDLHVIFLVLTISLIISIFSLMGKLRMKVIYFSSMMLFLTVIVVVKLYQKTIFSFVSNFSDALITSAEVFKKVINEEYKGEFHDLDINTENNEDVASLTTDIDSIMELQLVLEIESKDSIQNTYIVEKTNQNKETLIKPDAKKYYARTIKTQNKEGTKTETKTETIKTIKRKRTNNTFNSDQNKSSNISYDQRNNPTLINAVIPRSKKLMHNSYVDVITTKSYYINGYLVPKSSSISLLFTVDDNKMYFKTNNMKYLGKNLNVELHAIELDNSKGILLTSTDRNEIKTILSKEEAIPFPSNYKLRLKCTY